MLKFTYIFLIFVFVSSTALAQDEAGDGVYFDEDVNQTSTTSSENTKEGQSDIDRLGGLEKFKDIAVIQKKYLNKTKRFELWGGGLLALNSQYFNMLGINAAMAYNFNENWALELEGLSISDLEKSITEGLRTGQYIETLDIVTPTYYVGLHLKWSPIYGKMTLRERTISPFEVFFTLGGGLTGTDDGQSVPTIHGGIGQLYPLSKNTTLRWNLGLNSFSAQAKEESRGTISGKKTNSNLFYLSVGLSVYLPFSDKR